MREAYHEQLDMLIDDLARMALLVEDAMGQAVAALLNADAQAARRVVLGSAQFASLADDIDERALILAARQQPVAADLRTIVAALRTTMDLERMSRLACHVAQVAEQRQPLCAVPPELAETIAQMGRFARTAAAEIAKALAARDWHAAARLDRSDDEMDRLQLGLYARVLDGSWPHGTQVAVDAALIGRYLERYTDHAVAVAHHVGFLAGRESLDPPPVHDRRA